MSKKIQDIEIMYELLVECRRIFKNLNGDSVVIVSDMQKVCVRIDSLLGLENSLGSAEIDKDYFTK